MLADAVTRGSWSVAPVDARITSAANPDAASRVTTSRVAASRVTTSRVAASRVAASHLAASRPATSRLAAPRAARGHRALVGAWLLALGGVAACASGSTGGRNGDDTSDAGTHDTRDAGDDTADGGTGDGGVADGGSGDGGHGDGMPVPLAACADPVMTYGPLPTGVTWPQASDPGPLMPRGARAFVFLEGSALWTIAQAGSASTVARPAQLADVTQLGGFASLAGPGVLTYLRGGAPHAATFDGTTVGQDVAIPCTSLGADCVARAAPDGHLWVHHQNVFHEQTGTTFANRGGGPASPAYWDVDASGAVIVLAYGDPNLGEKLAIWKLAAGAGGWAKVGALLASDVATSAIEGGFQLSGFGPGTIAPDGSVHVFSDPRCIGTGERNKVQVYARSRDGVQWSVEALPAADALHAGNVTWKHAAFWASDYDNVRYVVTSSPEPTFDGFTWSYPDRRYDVIGRCLDANQQPVFARLASSRLRGWTTRGYAGFGAIGTASLLTDEGLVQIAP